jgi:hypothetical protein
MQKNNLTSKTERNMLVSIGCGEIENKNAGLARDGRKFAREGERLLSGSISFPLFLWEGGCWYWE